MREQNRPNPSRERERPSFGRHPMENLLIYDGLCGFCNRSIRWLLRHDKFDRLRFAPQQSVLAENILARHGIDRQAMLDSNSVYLVVHINSPDESLLLRSDVTCHALLLLGGVWKALGRCLQIIPRSLRDRVYTLIARNRFRIAGRYESCPLPTKEERAKFVGLTGSSV